MPQPEFSIVIAWRGDGARERAFQFVRTFWSETFPSAELAIRAPTQTPVITRLGWSSPGGTWPPLATRPRCGTYSRNAMIGAKRERTPQGGDLLIRKCPHGIDVGPLDDYGVPEGESVTSTYCWHCAGCPEDGPNEPFYENRPETASAVVREAGGTVGT